MKCSANELAGGIAGVMLSIIYMEICQRLGLEVNGAAVGQDFVVWPVLDGCAQVCPTVTSIVSFFQ